MDKEKDEKGLEKNGKVIPFKKDLNDTEIEKDELVQSLGFYIGGKAGVSDEISPKEAGIKGAFIEDIKETGRKFLEGEISEEGAEEEFIKKTTSKVIAPIVEKVVETVVDKAVSFVSDKVKTVSDIIKPFAPKISENINKTIKEVKKEAPKIAKGIARKAVEKVGEVAKKVIKTGKKIVKKLFGLFG